MDSNTKIFIKAIVKSNGTRISRKQFYDYCDNLLIDKDNFQDKVVPMVYELKKDNWRFCDNTIFSKFEEVVEFNVAVYASVNVLTENGKIICK